MHARLVVSMGQLNVRFRNVRNVRSGFAAHLGGGVAYREEAYHRINKKKWHDACKAHCVNGQLHAVRGDSCWLVPAMLAASAQAFV